MRDGQPVERPTRAWAYLLLVIPFVALLWVPFYGSASPQFAGIPYFYWYQFLWILISAALTAIVYLVTSEPGLRPEPLSGDGEGRASRD